MHIAVNAWFWNRPDTGSGQYVRSLVTNLPEVAPGLNLTLVAPEGWEIDQLPSGVSVERAKLRGARHRGKVFFEQRLFPRVAAQVGADLAHVPYWGSPLQSPVPVVVTIHDLIPLMLPAYRGGVMARLYTALVAAAARGAAAVITDSEASRGDILQHLSLPPERVTAIPLAAGDAYRPLPDGLPDVRIRQKYDLPPEYVLYLGGYDVRKNIGKLLEAYTYVRAGCDIPLVLAGRLPESITPRFWDVPALIGQLELGDVVHPIGWVDEGDKPALYRMASCFVFPSSYEGFGLPVLEAMACGTPVVAAETSSIPEIVGDAAFLIDPGDARHLAGSILAVLVQEELARDLRQKGLARAREFSWTRTAAETVSVYCTARMPPSKLGG
jgi:glycosyltransferase involved in cell wall biosynthesis